MKPQSRYVIHIGVNFLMVPTPTVSAQYALNFQQALLNNGLEFQHVSTLDHAISIAREQPTTLQIMVANSNPTAQVGQLVIESSSLTTSLTVPTFLQQAEAIIESFESVWEARARQIITASATIRQLYETTMPHAFQELWEDLLGQSTEGLAVFGKPVRGGGLRFVLEPSVAEQDPVREIKIESFLNDTSKVFVEIGFSWPPPLQLQSLSSIKDQVLGMNEFIENEVAAFIRGNQ